MRASAAAARGDARRRRGRGLIVEGNMQKNNPNNLKRNYTYFAVKKEKKKKEKDT